MLCDCGEEAEISVPVWLSDWGAIKDEVYVICNYNCVVIRYMFLLMDSKWSEKY